MPLPVTLTFLPTDSAALAGAGGRIALLVPPEGRLDPAGRKLAGLTRGGLARLLASDAWAKLKPGEAAEIGYPAGLEAEALVVVKLAPRATLAEARKAGSAIARARGTGDLVVLAGGTQQAAQVALGLCLRAYGFALHKTADQPKIGQTVMMCADPVAVQAAFAPLAALADGVGFARDLVSEPANVLTTTAFADRLVAMRDLGLQVEVLEEADLEPLGMGLLLAVGQGSASPSKVVVMQWNGAGDAQPFALVGKGVVFDSGGISIKAAGGMEEMTMDMGGAGVVAGVMRTLALRRAPVNVVGLVGLVENMPSGTAMRPGDIVASMKGDTVEIVNTDAEGRLVLADLLWYAQERFQPRGIINLATLTGAIIVALGSENAGVFSNDDTLVDAFLAAAKAEGEGAWRMPMGDGYDALLKSHLADMKNIGGREGGSIIAAQFLRRFIKDGVPWCHLDIAGVTLAKGDTTLAPKGATGWGVMALNRLIADRFEGV